MLRYAIQLVVLGLGTFLGWRLARSISDDETLQMIIGLAGVVVSSVAGREIARRSVRAANE